MKNFQLNAIAIALMSVFSAANADTVDIPAIPANPTITVDRASDTGKVPLKEGETGVIYAPVGATSGETPTLIYASDGKTMTNEGTVWVVGGPNYGLRAEGMGGQYIAGDTIVNTVINKGTIYVLGNGDKKTQIKAMGSNPGARAENQGEIVVDGVYGIVVNSGSGIHEAVNGEAGTIRVTNGGYGMYFDKDLASSSRVTMSNAGEIYANGENSHGVYLGSDENNFTFRNTGLIESADGANAITVGSGTFTISLEDESNINGKVVANSSKTTIKAVNNEDAFTLDAAKLAALELTNSSLTLEGDQTTGTTIGTLSIDKDSGLVINGKRDILVETNLTNTGSISVNHLSVDGGLFNNQGIINVQTLDLYGNANDKGEIAGQINASEKITYRGIAGNLLGRSLSATLNTPLLHIIGDKSQTGFLISDNDVLANVQKVQIESKGQRTGLTFQGDITIDSEIEFLGTADSRIEINEGSDVKLTKLTSSSADGKLQINKGGQVVVDDLQLAENSKLNLEVLSAEKPAEAVFNLNEITVGNGASLNASVYQEKQPDIVIKGNLDINLGNGAVVDFGGRKNSDWLDTKIHIESEQINVNVADSEKHGTVYLSKAGTDLDKTTVTVNADGSNNTGNAVEDLSKLTDVVLLTAKDDYTADQGDVTQKEAVDGAQLSVEANDIYDASQATLIVNENGESALGNVQTTANANIHGISEMAALGLHIWRNEINDMNKRLGELRDSADQSSGVWARVYNGRAEFGGQNITNKYTAFQFGLDRQVSQGVWVGGAVSYTNGDNDFSYGGGDSSLLAFTAYGSWLADNGLFLDVTGKVGRMKNTFDITMPAFTSSGDYHTNAVSVSAEAGWRFYPTEMVYLEPQVEFMYGHVDGVDYSTSTGVNVSQKAADAMIGRAGFVLGVQCPQDRGNAYIRASVLHDWDGEADFAFSKDNGAARSLTEDLGGTWYEYGIGFNLNATNKTHIYADLEASDGGEVDTDYRINVGVRYAW